MSNKHKGAAPPASAPKAPATAETGPAGPMPSPEALAGPPSAANFDPVEAAKVAAAEVPVRDATMHAPGLLTPPMPELPPVLEELEVEKAQPGLPPPDTSKWAKPPRYRVIKGGKAQFRRSRQHFPDGKVLDGGSYSDDDIASLRQQGIELIEVEDMNASPKIELLVAKILEVERLVKELSPEEQAELERTMHRQVMRKEAKLAKLQDDLEKLAKDLEGNQARRDELEKAAQTA